MIDITTYRSRIGQFSQKISQRKYLYRREFYYKYCWNENSAGKNAFIGTKVFLKIVVILTLLSGSSSPLLSDAGELGQAVHGGGQVSTVQYMGTAGDVLGGNCILRGGKQSTSNFYARYTYGNRSQKGIKNLHLKDVFDFNPKSLIW